MSNIHIECFVEGCAKFPEFLCNCQGLAIMMCDEHIKVHCQTGSSHSLSTIPTKMKSEELRKALSAKTNELRANKNELTSMVFEYIKQLIAKLDEIVKNCNNVEANYNNLYNKEIQSEEIVISPIAIIDQIENNMREQSNELQKSISDFASILNFEANSYVKDRLEQQEKAIQHGLTKLYEKCNETLQRLSIEDNTAIINDDPFSVIENKITLLYNQFVVIQNYNEELKGKNNELNMKILELGGENALIKIKTENSENNSECKTSDSPKKRQKTSETKVPSSSIMESDTMISFINNSKTLNKLNIISKEKSNFVLNIPENVTEYTACCQLPDGKIFCYGNYRVDDSSYSGIAFIIDSNYNVELLSEWIPCAYSSCAYIEGMVFIFGGKNDEGDLTIAAKYSIAGKNWVRCRNLPSPSHGCSIAYFNKYFYISGVNHDTLYAYNVDTDDYTQRDVNFQRGIPRIIICLKYQILICDSEDNHHKSTTGKEWMHGKIAGFPNKIPSSYKIRNDATVLFCCENNYYIFSTKAKDKIKCIATQ